MEFGFDVHQQVMDEKSKSNTNGSGLSKQERSDPFDEEGNRVSKMGKRVDEMGLRSDNNNNNNKEQMLSFSSDNKPEVIGFISADDVRLISSDNKNGLSFYHHQTSSTPTTGFSHGNMNGGMHGSITGIRGPFTPAQWIELEHQAMIYKYFTANVPVPSNLLIPIQKAIQSARFSGFSIGSFPSHTYGWGSLHLGFSGNSDPEPGRCRRTDGKKWRCSRDAVPDQKYCERHINRGRHRSRKPVESQPGQAATTKVLPSLVTPGGGVAIAQHHIKALHPSGATTATTGPITKRLNDQQGLSVMPSTLTLESKNSQYPNPKHHMPYDESSVLEFGIVSNDSLLNPSQKSSYMDCKSYNTLLEFNNPKNQDRYPPQHLMDNWPKDQPQPSANPWPENPKSDWTELSMSIPMSADFSLSSASPNQDKPCASPSRLSREPNPSHTEESTRQDSWIPIAYGNATGGPLGEVLLNNTSDGIDIGEGWDGSPQLGSSPTGVLQKSTFVSLSNNGSPLGHV